MGTVVKGEEKKSKGNDQIQRAIRNKRNKRVRDKGRKEKGIDIQNCIAVCIDRGDRRLANGARVSHRRCSVLVVIQLKETPFIMVTSQLRSKRNERNKLIESRTASVYEFNVFVRFEKSVIIHFTRPGWICASR